MILIVDMGFKYNSLGFEEFVGPIDSVVSGFDSTAVRHYSSMDSKVANSYEGIILSGAPLKDNGYMKNAKKLSWIRDFEKPLLGICAGMQAISIAHGAELVRCQEIGMQEIETTVENYLFSGRFEAYELHNYTVKPTSDFEVIGQSIKCSQAIKHKDKPTYGVLFHPEVRNINILENFAKITTSE